MFYGVNGRQCGHETQDDGDRWILQSILWRSLLLALSLGVEFCVVVMIARSVKLWS